MDEKKITVFYSGDHDQLDGYFKKFQELKREDYPQAKEYFKKFKFGLQRHIVWEEEILFPLFEEKTGMKHGGPTEVMRHEHRQIKTYLEEVHKKVLCQNPQSDEEEQLLGDILKQHNHKEENILYPAIDRSVSDEERQNVFGDMQALSEHKYKTCGQGDLD